MIQVTKSFLPTLSQYSKYLEKIWETGQFTNNGPLVKELSAHLSDFLGVEKLTLVANGTLALQLAIKALDIKGEVITTPFSYVATATAIAWEGCVPIFVDIDEKTFCINPDLIEEAITDKTSAILATHVYGYPCAVVRIEQIARKHNLKVLYDAAHCFGVKLDGRSILEYGDISTLSFHATKLFHTAEGGAVVCQDEAVFKRIFLMKKFGHIGEDDYQDIGINAKMSELHAAMGLCVLPQVEELIGHRRQCVEHYDELLADSAIERPGIPAGVDYNYAYYPVILPSHRRMLDVRSMLNQEGFGTRRYFYPALNTLSYLSASRQKKCPVAEDIADRVLCLPLSHEISPKMQQRIVEIMRRVVG